MDVEMIARHIQLLSKLLSVESLPEGFKGAGMRIPAHAFTNSGGKVISLEEAKSITREQLISNYHPMGCCMMALREKGSVVSETLRVYGVKGLSVNASWMRVCSRGAKGNIIKSVYVAAEKVTDLTKED
jgi:choline dehydrogenase-like flavoprotein